ncbi:MAG TPA: hypothetical protein VFB45_26645 [Pseudolabrys sp.]|nr:hypothetical protein [Pseudolabrys sp.]
MIVLSFVVVVAARMIDPIGIVLAVAIGAAATTPKHPGFRGGIVLVGALFVTIAFTVLTSALDASMGIRHSTASAPFTLATTYTSLALEMALAAWLIGRWRARRAHPPIA